MKFPYFQVFLRSFAIWVGPGTSKTSIFLQEYQPFQHGAARSPPSRSKSDFYQKSIKITGIWDNSIKMEKFTEINGILLISRLRWSQAIYVYTCSLCLCYIQPRPRLYMYIALAQAVHIEPRPSLYIAKAQAIHTYIQPRPRLYIGYIQPRPRLYLYIQPRPRLYIYSLGLGYICIQPWPRLYIQSLGLAYIQPRPRLYIFICIYETLFFV